MSARPDPLAEIVRAPDWGRLAAVIFDVDGVLMDSPHERAWRQALAGFAAPDQFTTAFYQAHVAGKPRVAGALACLEALGVPDAAARAANYARVKQARLEALIAAGEVHPYPDALRLVESLLAAGWPMAAASSSKNANAMMAPIRLETGKALLACFKANVCGRDVSQGKPNPEIFLLAAEALGAPPDGCVVFEDAPAGVEAGRAGGMTTVGVARHGDAAPLRAAGANQVVASLDEVADVEMFEGPMRRRGR